MTSRNTAKSKDILSSYFRPTINNIVVFLKIYFQRHWWALKTIRGHGSFDLAIIEFFNRSKKKKKNS